MNARIDRVPDVLVERLALGELDPLDAESIRRRLRAEPGGLERLAAIKRSNEQILQEYPALPHSHRAERRSSTPRWVMVGAAGLAMAAVVMFAVTSSPPDPTGVGAQENVGERIKGTPQLRLFRKKGSTTEPLRPGDAAAPNDLVQLKIMPASARHGAVISMDGNGETTLHWPARPGESTQMQRRPFALTHAYQLDDAPDFERFVLVTSTEPIDTRVVLKAAKEAASDSKQALALPDNLQQYDLLLRKVSP